MMNSKARCLMAGGQLARPERTRGGGHRQCWRPEKCEGFLSFRTYVGVIGKVGKKVTKRNYLLQSQSEPQHSHTWALFPKTNLFFPSPKGNSIRERPAAPAVHIPLREKLLTGSKMKNTAQGGRLPREADGKEVQPSWALWDTQVTVMGSEDNHMIG